MAGCWAPRSLDGGDGVSRRQFGFLIGVLLVWLAWDAGWVVLAGVAAGLIGYGIVTVAGR